MKITDRAGAALACPEGRYDLVVADDVLRGFRVRALASGAKLFVFSYKVGGVSRRIPLGTFGEVTAAKARERAERLRGAVLDGRDPWTERRDTRAEALQAEAEARRKTEADRYTVRCLLHDWDRLALAKRRLSYRRDVLSRLNVHLAKIMDKPAAAVTRAEAARAVDRAAENGGATTSRRVKQYASTMFTWGAGRRDGLGNPFFGVAGAGAEAPRDRVLTREEVGAVWRAAGTLPPPFGPFVRVLLLTLARREEVAAMRWHELAPDLSAWTLPAARSKNRKPHVQHLAEPPRAILAGMVRGEADELVFATLAGKAISTHSYIKRLLDKAIAAERAEAEQPPMPTWVFHDFRRTGVTVLAEAGFPPHVADKLLNHVSGTIRGVAAIYQRGEFLAERKAALEAWSLHVLRCGEGSADAAAGNLAVLATERAQRRA